VLDVIGKDMQRDPEWRAAKDKADEVRNARLAAKEQCKVARQTATMEQAGKEQAGKEQAGKEQAEDAFQRALLLEPPIGSYEASPEYKRMCNAVGVDVLGPGVGLYQLQYDACLPYKSITYSVGLISISSKNLLPEDQRKRNNIRPLVAICGPQQPANPQPALLRTLRTFAAINKAPYNGLDLGGGRKELIYLDGLIGDTMGRIKFSKEIGPVGYRACGGCGFKGCK
jgi:hypothetical protein